MTSIVRQIRKHLAKTGELELKIESVVERDLKDGEVVYLIKWEDTPLDSKDPSNWCTREEFSEETVHLVDEYEKQRMSKNGMPKRSNSLVKVATASKPFNLKKRNIPSDEDSESGDDSRKKQKIQQ